MEQVEACYPLAELFCYAQVTFHVVSHMESKGRDPAVAKEPIATAHMHATSTEFHFKLVLGLTGFLSAVKKNPSLILLTLMCQVAKPGL